MLFSHSSLFSESIIIWIFPKKEGGNEAHVGIAAGSCINAIQGSIDREGLLPHPLKGGRMKDYIKSL